MRVHHRTLAARVHTQHQRLLVLLVLLFVSGGVLAAFPRSVDAAEVAITDVQGVGNGTSLQGKIVIAVQTSGPVHTVSFRLKGARSTTHIEYKAPYTFMGGRNGKPFGWDTTKWPNGDYSLSITACARWRPCTSTTRSFRIANPLPGRGQPVQPGATSTTPPLSGPATPPVASDPPPSRPTLQAPRVWRMTNADPTYSGNGEDLFVVVAEKITVPAGIKGVRNFVMIGGEFAIAKPLPLVRPCNSLDCNDREAMRHKALSFANISGTGYVEGIYINGTNGNLTEGLQIWGSEQGTIVVVNSRIEGLRLPSNDLDDALFNHPDLVQLMGGSLKLRNVSLVGSPFQGLFMQTEHGNALGTVEVERLNIRKVRRQAFFLSRPGRDGRVITRMANVWNDQDSTSRYPYTWDYPFLPEPSDVTSDWIRWNNQARIVPGAMIRNGSPPGGDFAPASQVGRTYNPGYFVQQGG